ncbi:hypothetical protein B7P43_G17404 [Cryptotermes secundus]|uniref:DUF4817 domain-containing protein n=1 Tax=Cryptotermes secundus TaxID=105785 RepID=A0A2J7QY82_9NEOP|nr:hypothetical protein B7P43_G17404 [Cryptotermes secundus]
MAATGALKSRRSSGNVQFFVYPQEWRVLSKRRSVFSSSRKQIQLSRCSVLFEGDSACPKNIRRWFRQFQESGCLCKGKNPGRPRVSEEQVARIRAAFERSPRKSTNRASRELAIPQSTVWRVLTVRLHLKPYRLQLVQALTNDDKRKRTEFCDSMLEMMEDETFISRLIFSDEATFHLSGTVNRHSACRLQGQTYLDMLQNWRFTSLQADSHDLIFQQDGAPPHWHLMVRAFLNEKVPQRWIGRKGAKGLALCAWPARPPDLTVCDFFLWGYVRAHVYVPPLPTNLDDLKHRIIIK